MGIAYTHRFITKQFLDASTRSNFRNDVDTALTSANWTVIRSVTNGKVYECVAAPVSTLKLRLLVQDSGTANLVNFQVYSQDETGFGAVHTIYCGDVAIPIYQCIVGCSQFFLSIPGQVGSGTIAHQSSSFACGVPSLPYGTARPDCFAVGAPGIITDIWWSCGSGDNGLFLAPDWRSAPRCFQCYSFSLNHSVTTVTGGSIDPTQGMLGLFYLTPTGNVDSIAYTAVPILTYAINSTLYTDSLMGWLWQVRGQLWDSFLQSGPQPLDNVSTYIDDDVYGREFSFPAQAWMSSYYSTLRLLTQSPGGGEFAYIYGGTH